MEATPELTPREQRGIQIVSRYGDAIKETAKAMWSVPSQRMPGVVYRVDMRNGRGACNCPDYELRQMACKHCVAVTILVLRQPMPDQTAEQQVAVVRVTYPRPGGWPVYNKSQVMEPLLFEKLAVQLCHSTVPQPEYIFGRPFAPLANVVLMGIMRGYTSEASRRTQGWMQRLDTVEDIPAYNTFLKYFKRESLTSVLQTVLARSALPFRGLENIFAIDSSGFTSTGYHRWFNLKHGGEEKQQKWVKAHIMSGVRSHCVTSLVVTDQDGADCPQFEPLVRSTIAGGFAGTIERIVGDKAYLSKDNFKLAREIGGEAIIAFKDNSVAGKDPDWRRAFHLFEADREEYFRQYHARSNVETTFSLLKRRFEEHLLSKTFSAQANELYARAIAHNIVCIIRTIHELGMVDRFLKEVEGTVPGLPNVLEAVA